jgi:hypothetical protein
MYPHEGSGESVQPTNYLQPLPSATPEQNRPPASYGQRPPTDAHQDFSAPPVSPAHPGYAAQPGYPAKPGYPAEPVSPAHQGYAAQSAYPGQPVSPAQPEYPAQPAAGTLGRLGFDNATDDDEPADRRASVPSRPLLLGDLLAGAASLVLFFASFTPFVSYDNAKLTADLEKLGLSTWFTAWSGQTFMAPLTWFAILSALAVVAISAVRYLRGGDRRLLTFTLPQLQLVLAVFSAITLIGYAASRKSVLFGADYAAVIGKAQATTAFDTRLSLSFGGYVMLVAALVAVAGAALNVLGIERVLLPRAPKPAPAPRSAPRTDSPFYGSASPTSGPGAQAAQVSSPPQYGGGTWDSTRQWESGPAWENAQPPAEPGYRQPYAPDPLTDPSYSQPPRPPGTVYGRPPE